jgi:hypothetical protein
MDTEMHQVNGCSLNALTRICFVKLKLLLIAIEVRRNMLTNDMSTFFSSFAERREIFPSTLGHQR